MLDQFKKSNDRKVGLKKSHKNRVAGFLSIEAIVVLVVLLSLLASSAGRVASLFTASSSASAASHVLELQTSTRSLRTVAGYGTTGTDLSKVLIDSGSVPSGLVTANSSILNEWNGKIEIVSILDGAGFTVSYPSVPKSVCSQVVTQLLNSGNFRAVSIDGSMLKLDSDVEAISAAIEKVKTSGAELIFYVDVDPEEGPGY